MSIKIFQGDCRKMLPALRAEIVDSIVTDPPYELTNRGGGPSGRGEGTPHSRARAGAATGGFMGMKWDGTGVAFDVKTWAECLRVLKPGGYLLAFSGTRTYHRMVCAIEDAGFEIRDQIGWVYGSGFPKSHNGPWGGTALKPAWEPIVLARKPLIGTVEANWREHGTGALNIDPCRIEGEKPATTRGASSKASSMCGTLGGQGRIEDDGLGRWPANLIHDGSDEVLQAFPETTTNGTGRGGVAKNSASQVYGGFSGAGDVPRVYGTNSGSAARFFYCAKADRADRNAGLEDPGPQFKKGSTLRDAENLNAAGARKGNHHPTVKPTDLMRYLCRLVTPAGGTVLDPFMGSGSTLKAAELEGFSAIGIELSPEYIDIARRRIAADAPLFQEVA